MVKRWKCTVCGYIHVGKEPPEVCPVCGADRSKFVLLEDDQNSLLSDMVRVFKLHPVMAHFPGGLLPTAILFLLLSLVTGQAALESAVFWMVLVVTVAVPVSIGSGLHDWRKSFGGRRTLIFFKKIGLALTLLVLGLVAVNLRYGRPELLSTFSWQSVVYVTVLLGMLGCVTLLGHYGSLLAMQVKAVPEPAQQEEGPAVGSARGWSQMIVEQAPDAVLAADTFGTICLWNPGAERIFSIPAKQALGQSLDLVIPENLRQRHWQGWAEVMASGKSRYGESDMLRVPALRGDGSRFSAEFSIVMLKDETEKIFGIAAVLRDVSEQWEREKNLKKQLEACLQRHPDGDISG